MTERGSVVFLALVGLSLAGCADSETDAVAISIASFEAPAPFVPGSGSARLEIALDVDRLPPEPAIVSASFEIVQGGGIPVRTLTASKTISRTGKVQLEATWDGTDRSGRVVHTDSYEALVDVTLARFSKPDSILAELAPVRARQLDACTRQHRCVVVSACAGADTEPERCRPPFFESRYVCNFVGGFAGPPPLSSWNFHGTGDPGPIRLPYALDANDRYGKDAPPGGNPKNSENPIVAGTDLGSPFEHVFPNGEKKLVFLFGDSSPLSLESYAHDTSGNLFPSGTPFGVYPSNDDSMAISDQAPDDPPTGPEHCLDLVFFRGGAAIDPVQNLPESELIEPITLDGPFTVNPLASTVSGIDLGYTRVPGPGFSVGQKLFALMPAANDATIGISCDPSHPCSGSDQCLGSPPMCYFGDCSTFDGSTACFKRNAPATLATSDAADPHFRSLTAAEYEPGALDVYRERADIIPPIAFYVSDSELYVWGRNQIVGHPKAPAELKFWKHAISSRIGVPVFFAGCDDDPKICDSPRFSPNESNALPVYEEDRPIANQTSVTYLPSFGAWVMIYGGRLPIWTRAHYPSLNEERALDPYAGIVLRTAKHAWGPWSSPVTIYDPYWTNVPGYCELMYRTAHQAAMLETRVAPGFSKLDCDPASPVQTNSTRPPEEFGAEYGSAIVPRFIQDGPMQASFYWLLGTWNPYRVVLMKTAISRVPGGDASQK